MKSCMSVIETIIKEVVDREGGYIDHPADKGGPTNFGVTLRTLKAWRGTDVTSTDIRHLERAEAERMLMHKYVLKPGIFALGWPSVIAKVSDMSVHHGPRRAIKMLQRACGVEEDGIMGPTTCNKADSINHQTLVTKMVQIRTIRFVRIVKHDPTQIVFLEGWIKRAHSFLPHVNKTA